MKPTKQLIEYIYNHDEVQRQIRFNSKAKDFLAKFTEEIYADIKHIIDKEKSFTETDWENLFEKYKKEPESPVLQALMESDYVSDDLRNRMVEWLIKGEYEGRFNLNDQRDHTLMRALTKPNITTKNILAITEFMSRNQFNMETFIYNYSNRIEDKYLKLIANRYLTTKSEAKKTNCNDVLRECLLNIKDEKFIRNLLENFPLEKYRNVLISNNKLSDEFRKEIYDMGVNIQKIDFRNLSKDVFDDAYTCVCDAFFDLDITAKNFEREKKAAFSADDKRMIKVFTDAKNILWYTIPSLSPAQEYDLFLRIKSMSLTKENETMRRILMSTKNEKLLKEALELKSVAHREQALHNEHMPMELINQKINEISEKALKVYRKNGTFKMSARDAKLLLELMCDRNAKVTDEVQLIVANILNDWDKMKMIARRETPNDVLDSIIKYAKITPINCPRDANLGIIATVNKNVDKKYQGKCFNDVLSSLVYSDYGMQESHYINLYKENKEIKPFIEDMKKELGDLLIKNPKNPRDTHINTQINKMNELLDSVLNNISALEKNCGEVCKESTRYLLHEEMFPFLSHKYFVLDFYMEIETKVENITKILQNMDEIEKKEIMAEKLAER